MSQARRLPARWQADRPPRVFAPVGQMDSSAMWRVAQPFAYLSGRGYPCSWNYMNSIDAGIEAAMADIVILPRLYWHNKRAEAEYINRLRRAGKVVLWECDDDMFSFRPSMSAAWDESHKRSWFVWAAKARRIVKRCDGMTVSTPYLRARAYQHTRENQPIYVVPNLIDLDWWGSLLSYAVRQTSGITVGWVGAKRNPADLAEMLKGWEIVAAQRPDVSFCTAGHEFDEFDNAVPRNRRTHIPWTTLWEYPAAYVNIDIGCAPLAPTMFNACKSPIKVMEYAAAGAAVIASPTVYADHFDANGGLFIARTGEEWARAIMDLVDSPSLRQSRAAEIKAEVFLDHSLERRSSLITETWGRAAALPRVLAPLQSISRVPRI